MRNQKDTHLFFLPFLLIVYVLVAACLSDAKGQATIPELQLTQSLDTLLDVLPYVQCYVDTTKKLSYKEIRKEGTALPLIPYSELKKGRKFSKVYTYWLYLSVENTRNEPIEAVLDMNCLSKMTVFHSSNHTLIDSFFYGRDYMLPEGKTGNIISNRCYQPLHLVSGKQQIWVKIEPSSLAARPRFRFYQPKYFIEKQSSNLIRTYLVGIGISSCFLFILLYSFVHYYQERDRVFLLYALYTFLAGFIYFRSVDFDGHLYSFFPYWVKYFSVYIVGTLCFYITYMQFVRMFLNTKKNLPVVERFIQFMSWFLFISMVFLLGLYYTGEGKLAWKLMTYLKIGFILSGIYVIVMLFRAGTRLANFILAGTLVLLVGGLLSAILPFFITSDSHEWINLFGIFGVLVENLFFMAGLSFRSQQKIKDKEKVERALLLKEQEAERYREMDDFKTAFYTNITHEFRTPLQVVQGVVDKLEEQNNAIKTTDYQLVKRNINRLLQLIQQMLDLSNYEKEVSPLQYEKVDLSAQLKQFCDAFKYLAQQKNIDLTFNATTEQLDAHIPIEQTQVITSNLLSNALKYTPENGTIKVQVNQKEVDWVNISIWNSGAGIAPTDLPYIFDRLYKGENSLMQESTGIGLYIVRNLTHKLGGTITTTSTPEEGTVFNVKLPIGEAAAKHEEPSLNATQSTNSSKEQQLILVVEDHHDVRQLILDWLTPNYTCIAAKNGLEGLNMTLEQQPDLIVSDIMMPIMDGIEMAKLLKEDTTTAHIPILFLTAKSGEQNRIKGLEEGAISYLEKPVAAPQLLAQISSVLEQMARQEAFLRDYLHSETDKKRPSVILAIEQVILNHLDDEQLSVHLLSEKMHMSRSQLHRKIKEHTQLTSTQFINSIRLQFAMQLLKTTDLPIKSIVYQTGFKSPAYFSAQFRKIYECTPKSIRE